MVQTLKSEDSTDPINFEFQFLIPSIINTTLLNLPGYVVDQYMSIIKGRCIDAENFFSNLPLHAQTLNMRDQECISDIIEFSEHVNYKSQLQIE